MDVDYDDFEIAAVIRDFWLIDAESYQRKYATQHGYPLTPGFYVVNWPEHVRAKRFNEHAHFHGPFSSRKEVQMALDLMHKAWRGFSRPTEMPAVVAGDTRRLVEHAVKSAAARLQNGAFRREARRYFHPEQIQTMFRQIKQREIC